MLTIKNLSVSLNEKQLLSDISLQVASGVIQVCMGANGSGKSSLAATIMGHPRYQVTSGSIHFLDEDITNMSVDKRARKGIFLSLQQPYAIPGVTLSTLLRESFHAIYGVGSLDVYIDRLTQALRVLKIDATFLQRPVHEGFSGGEKKKCEMLQLLILQPKLAILDEIDSGLDVDALKLVADALKAFKIVAPESSLFVISHYQRLLELIQPDGVCVLDKGKLVASGGPELMGRIERDGYEIF